jgi:hypothetical protein
MDQMTVKKLMFACEAIFFALGNIAMADQLPAVPKKFQGTWVEVGGGNDGGIMTIGANTVSFGSPRDTLPGDEFKLKLINIEPANEGLTEVEVKWSTNPGTNVIAVVWHWIKVNGRQALIVVNATEPSSNGLYLKR